MVSLLSRLYGLGKVNISNDDRTMERLAEIEFIENHLVELIATAVALGTNGETASNRKYEIKD
jgi:hypothetical protein